MAAPDRIEPRHVGYRGVEPDVRSVYRVKAWRRPNEDGAADHVTANRASVASYALFDFTGYAQ